MDLLCSNELRQTTSLVFLHYQDMYIPYSSVYIYTYLLNKKEVHDFLIFTLLLFLFVSFSVFSGFCFLFSVFCSLSSVLEYVLTTASYFVATAATTTRGIRIGGRGDVS